MTKAQLQTELTRALERIAELEAGASDPEVELAKARRQIADLERDALDAEEIVAERDEARAVPARNYAKAFARIA